MKPHFKSVLIINPPVYDFAAFDLWAKPLGMLYLSSILKQNGFEVKLLDYMYRHFGGAESESDKYGCGHYNKARIEKPQVYNDVPRYYSRFGLDKDIAENYLKELCSSGYMPDAVLITSVMTYWYPGVWEAVETVKRIFPEVPVCLGGAYAALCPEHAKNSGADHVVRGGFASLNKTFAELGFELHMPESFDKYPKPDFSFYPKSEYGVLRMSMGCPFRCSYCAQDILCDNKYEIKSPQAVFEEIKSFAGSGIKNIVFYDDALLYNAGENIKPLLKQIIKEKLNINIHTPNGMHTRYLDLELAELMKEAGFIKPRFSLETADALMQKETGAKVSNDMYISAMQALQKAGYKKGEYTTYLLIGMPGQSLESVEESVRFVYDLGSKISLSEYSLIPGTKEFKRQLGIRSEELGIKGKDFLSEPLLHNKSIFPLFNENNWAQAARIKTLAKNLNSLL